MKLCKALLFLALAITIGALVLWGLTGREVFTKQVRLSEIEREVDPEDFLDFARADAGGVIRETRREEGLWFGLLPSGHPRPEDWAPAPEWASVLTVAGPWWILAAGACLWRGARSRRLHEKSPEE